MGSIAGKGGCIFKGIKLLLCESPLPADKDFAFCLNDPSLGPALCASPRRCRKATSALLLC